MTEEKKKEILKEVKEDIRRGDHKKAFGRLNGVSEPSDDFVMQSRYASLFKNLDKKALGLKAPLRLAVLASSTSSHFVDVLKYWIAKEGFMAEIYEAQYDTVHQTILDPASPLYSFKPDITMIFTNYRDVKCDVPALSPSAEAKNAVKGAVKNFVSLWKTLKRNCDTFIIQNNADLPYHRSFGNYEGTAHWGRLNILRSFNLELARAALPGVVIFDIDYISSVYGRKSWHDVSYWYHSKHAFAPDATGLVAYDAAKVIGSVKGTSKKCVVLDLDNTIWGGVIGDDGLDGIALGSGPDGEAFADFQRFLLQLKKRGVILAVCSKNEEEIAKEPFLKHPDMQLKLDDIVIFKANWDDKASNIREIAAALNIGLDSIVFVDDNAAEREFVRRELPMVSVPELPQDPAGYVHALSGLSYFETVSFSEEDKARSGLYRDNAVRADLQKQFTDINDYLKSLEMEAAVGTFDDFSLPRIAQLINKSNQFHLTTTRYTEGQIRSMASDEDRYRCRYFRLKDRFGDNGLISAVILEKSGEEDLLIDTWVMSCRVLSRSLEEFIYSEMVSLAKEAGCKKIMGKYIPTNKNKLVSRLYEKLGFKMSGEENGATFWELKVNENTPVHETFIKKTVPARAGLKAGKARWKTRGIS